MKDPPRVPWEGQGDRAGVWAGVCRGAGQPCLRSQLSLIPCPRGKALPLEEARTVRRGILPGEAASGLSRDTVLWQENVTANKNCPGESVAEICGCTFFPFPSNNGSKGVHQCHTPKTLLPTSEIQNKILRELSCQPQIALQSQSDPSNVT